ncbi:MAG: hypothetical protein OXH36_01090, partial [Bdellovibrionales bacterium]|nr:hypothetical protein [Bdellovibrionales bacterium]
FVHFLPLKMAFPGRKRHFQDKERHFVGEPHNQRFGSEETQGKGHRSRETCPRGACPRESTVIPAEAGI